jgi:hypothetical protein
LKTKSEENKRNGEKVRRGGRQVRGQEEEEEEDRLKV